MARRHSIGFEVSLSAKDDGTIKAMYIQFSDMPVAETREFDGGALLGDYDETGDLVGLEILAPIRIAAIQAVIAPERREPVVNFLRTRGPRELVLQS